MITLLLVDDEESTLLGLSTLPWENIGITEVFLASSAFEAIDTVKLQRIDIVVSDIRMPGLSGVDLLMKLTEDPYNIKGILLSGYADFEYAKQAIQAKVLNYLLKPCSDEELLKAVQQAIEIIQEDRKKMIERQQLVKQLCEDPIWIGEKVLSYWLKNPPTIAELTKSIGEYQLPISIEDHYLYFEIRCSSKKECSIIEQKAVKYLSGHSFIMMLKSTDQNIISGLFIFGINNKIETDQFNYELLSDLKQYLLVNFQIECTIMTSDVYKLRDLSKLTEFKNGSLDQKLTIPSKTRGEVLVHRAQHYLYLKLSENPTLQDAAYYLNVHPAYLSKIFKEGSGEKFSEYIHRLKMEKAAYQIENTNKKINQIAKEIGYNDSSYFIKVFKKFYSKTPHEFRGG
ncbi:response regulator [Bacillus gibsonii]|nr:response regulator [Alkalicoccobacillus gibsonii]